MKKNKPRILIYDIETAPNLGRYFELYKEGNIVWKESDWYILCFAWKWLGENKTHVMSLPDFKTAYKKDRENDLALLEKLWDLFDEADVVIAHNGNSFDQKKVNARLIYHGFNPPTPYKQIDTKLVAKRYFRFDSNKLDDLGDYFQIGRKLQTGGIQLWKDCLAGNKKAWKKMTDYNKQDVILLEKVYEKMKPWINNHPNIALLNGDEEACPNCGSFEIQKRGFDYTRVGKSQRYQCQNCYSWHKRPIKGGQIR